MSIIQQFVCHALLPTVLCITLNFPTFSTCKLVVSWLKVAVVSDPNHTGNFSYEGSHELPAGAYEELLHSYVIT